MWLLSRTLKKKSFGTIQLWKSRKKWLLSITLKKKVLVQFKCQIKDDFCRELFRGKVLGQWGEEDDDFCQEFLERKVLEQFNCEGEEEENFCQELLRRKVLGQSTARGKKKKKISVNNSLEEKFWDSTNVKSYV